MSRDVNGDYTLPTNDSSPAVPRNVIRSSDFNEITGDLATALTDSLSRSGKGGMLADLDMGGNDLLAGGSAAFTGATLSTTGSAQTLLTINGDAASARRILLATAGTGRWFVQASSVAETGSNAGSDFEIVRRSDAGANLGTPLSIARATGVMTLSNAPVAPGLPNLSASVQSTGVPGLDGGRWMIWNSQTGASFDTIPTLRIDRNASPTVLGGVSGNTYQALKVNGTAGVNNQGYEWPLTVELHNKALGTLGSQNVAINATAWVESNGVGETGKTWGANLNVSDLTGTVNPAYGQVGVEINNYATTTASTDTNRSRCVLQLAYGTTDGATPGGGLPLHIGRGFLVGSFQANVILDRLMEVGGNGTFDIGIDTSAATFAKPVLFLAESQRIGFDGNTSGAYARSLRYQTGVLVYETASGQVVTISDAGDLTARALSLSATAGTALLTINGSAGQARRIQFSTSASARWLVQVNAVAESGANAGSDFEIVRRSDAGANLGTPISISRATGVVTLAQALTIGSTQVVSTRDTGWSSWTGASNKATVLDTGTATVGQVAQRVAAIQIALTTHGLLGA